MAEEARTGAPVPDVDDTSKGLFGVEEPAIPNEGLADENATDENAEEAPEAQDGGAAESSPGEAGAETATREELKVVVSVRGGRALVGVQRTGADPHIEAFDDRDMHSLAGEVNAVVERARARWEESPKHPAHARPVAQKAAAPARRRQRTNQGQPDSAALRAGSEQQSEALRLF